jgi:dienelactone hydrolase
MANTNQYWDFKPELFVSKDHGQIELFVRGEGPPLILLHELPGLADKTFELGDYFVKAGFKVILPLLLGRAGDDNVLFGFAKIMYSQRIEGSLARQGHQDSTSDSRVGYP